MIETPGPKAIENWELAGRGTTEGKKQSSIPATSYRDGGEADLTGLLLDAGRTIRHHLADVQ